MHELTKRDGVVPLVIKKSAAIFLLMTLTFIGSIPTATFAADMGHTTGMIAATPIVVTITNASVSNYIGLPDKVYSKPFDVPLLDKQNDLAIYILKPKDILDDKDNTSGIPSIMGVVTSAFGYRKHPIRGRVCHHDGIDLAAKLGSPVLSPADGIVTFAGIRNGYGKVIEIDHQNGYTTLLAHNSKLVVKVGDIVKSGMIVAKAGSTGFSTGVHIHVEIRRNGKLLNPVAFIVSN